MTNDKEREEEKLKINIEKKLIGGKITVNLSDETIRSIDQMVRKFLKGLER